MGLGGFLWPLPVVGPSFGASVLVPVHGNDEDQRRVLACLLLKVRRLTHVLNAS